MSTQWERARQPTIGFPKKEGHKLPYFWGWYVSRQDTSFGLSMPPPRSSSTSCQRGIQLQVLDCKKPRRQWSCWWWRWWWLGHETPTPKNQGFFGTYPKWSCRGWRFHEHFYWFFVYMTHQISLITYMLGFFWLVMFYFRLDGISEIRLELEDLVCTVGLLVLCPQQA